MSIPLQKQLVELLFHKGINTKGDPFQISIGEMIVLDNATFTAPGKIEKRNAYGLTGGSIANPAALFARGSELLQVADPAGSTLYSYNTGLGFVPKGLMPSVGVSVASAAQPQYSTFSIDMAQAPNGLQCFVYELVDMNQSATRKGIGYTVVDPATGQVVVPPSILEASTTAGLPHVICLGNTFVCYYVVGVVTVSSALLGRTLNSVSPLGGWSASTTLTSGSTLLALSLSKFKFDVVADATATNAYMLFSNGSASLTLAKIVSASPLVFGSTATIASSGSTPAVFMDRNGNVIAAIDGTQAKFTVYSTALAVVKALTSFASSADSGAAMTGVSTAAGAFTLFYSSALATNSQTISSGVVGGTNYGTIVNTNPVVRSIGIAAKAFAINGLPYLPAWFCFNTNSGGLQRFNTPQNALYVIDASGRVVSKALVGTTGGYETISLFNAGTPSYQLGATLINGLTATFSASNTNQIIGVIQNSQFGQVTPGESPLLLNYGYGAAAVSVAFGDTANAYQRAQLANEVHANGGVLQMYDGQNVVEHGFLVYPAFINVSLGAGGGLSAGTYQALAVYEWMDGQGQVHRSTPGVPVSFTATAGQAATYSVPMLSLTQKTGVVIQIYRTLVNGSVFFQETNFNAQGSLFNNPLAAAASWVDTQSDVAIEGNPTLYTTGGVLDNSSCAPAGAMVVHRNRLFVVDPTTGQIWFSKQVIAPAPVEFSGFQVLNIDPGGGYPTALGSLDDKLIVWKADRVFMVLGQGPDATGNQNDFTDAIPVSTDTGCTAPKSITVVPRGIIYQSPKGIYLLDHALNVTYIGAPLEGLLFSGLGVASITSGVLMSEVTQVRFGVPSGFGGHTLCFIYDYALGQWYSSSLNGHDKSIDACNVDGAYFNLTDTGLGVIEEQDGGTVDPFGLSILQSLTTGWIKVAGLQGFQRVYQMLMLGTGGGSLDVSVAYDYDPTIVDVIQIDAAFNQAAFQERVKFSRQKCEAIQLTIVETDARNGPGLSSLSALSFEIGVKKGPGYKLPASKTNGG